MKDEKETKDPIEELSGDIKRVIADNRKFLSRFLEEDFEPEEQVEEEDTPEEL
jgi:hypothetical protein